MRKQWTTAALVMSLGLAVPAFAQDDPTKQTGGQADESVQQPADGTSPAERARAAEATSGLNGEEYVVQTGDTLSGIAERFMGSSDQWRKLADANGIQNPDMISVGQKLDIPEGAQDTAPARNERTSQPEESSAPSGTTMPAPRDTDLPSSDEAMPPEPR